MVTHESYVLIRCPDNRYSLGKEFGTFENKTPDEVRRIFFERVVMQFEYNGMGFMGTREQVLVSVKKYLDTLPVIMALDGTCTLGAESRYYKETKAHDVRKYLVRHILAQVPNNLTYYGYGWTDYEDIKKHLESFDLEMDMNHFTLGPETLPLGSLVGTASEIKSAFIKIVMERIHNEIM